MFLASHKNIKEKIAKKITSVWDKLEDKYGRGVIYTGTKD